MTRIASLGMYEFASTYAALDALWAEVAARLRAAGMADVPEALTRDRPLEEIWRDPDLLIAQTCGYPLKKHLGGYVRVVATPVYDVPGCEGAFHRSFIVVPVDAPFASLADLRGTRAALNGNESGSGMNLFRAALAPVAGGRPMFASIGVTGSHAASFAAVAEGAADVAAIDCVSFWFITRERPDLAQRVRVLTETMATPGLPLVTRQAGDGGEVAALRQALETAVVSPSLADVREALRLRGFAVVPESAYDIVLDLEAGAAAAGYPALA
jgi:ABC-type phosphate/phosphonate transport system substrate-binding protein